MSHMTADLEYFKCDMCGVYMHRDIFCDHRRDCYGRDSTTLKRGECARLSDALSRETRELLLARENGCWSGNAASESTSKNHTTQFAQDGSQSEGGARSNFDNHVGGAARAGVAAESNSGAAAAPESDASSASHDSNTSRSCASTRTKGTAVELGRAGNQALVGISAAVSTAELERRQDARTRRAVSDRYQASLDAKISALLTEERKAALMDFLKS